MKKSDDNKDELLDKALEKISNRQDPKKLVERDLRILKKAEANNRLPHMNASKRYLVDDSYSKNPTSICGNTELGLPTCDKGEGRKCYWLGKCPSKSDDNGNLLNKGIYDEISHELVNEAKQKYDGHELDRIAEESAYGLLLALDKYNIDEID